MLDTLANRMTWADFRLTSRSSRYPSEAVRHRHDNMGIITKECSEKSPISAKLLRRS
jgi:hypothetical protein